MSVSRSAYYLPSVAGYVAYANSAGNIWDNTNSTASAPNTHWTNGYQVVTVTSDSYGRLTWTVPSNLPNGDWTELFWQESGASPSYGSDGVPVLQGSYIGSGSAQVSVSENFTTSGVNIGQVAGQTANASGAVTFPSSIGTSTYSGSDTSGTTTLLSRLSQAILWDGSGNVKANAEAVSDKTGYALTTGEHTAISGTDVPAGLTTQGYTTTRAGYLDTLNGLVASTWNALSSGFTTSGSVGANLVSKLFGISGQAASQADVQAVQNNTTISISLPPWLQIPASGSVAYPFAIYLMDTDGTMVNQDGGVNGGLPVITLTDQTGSSLSSKLSSLTAAATGKYTGTITVSSSDAELIANLEVTATVGGNARVIGKQTDVTAQVTSTFTSTDRTTLNAAATATALATLQTTANTINTSVGSAGAGLTGLPAVTLASSQPNYTPATASALSTLQTTASTINTSVGSAGAGLTGLPAVTLASSQPNYAPATAASLSSCAASAATAATQATNAASSAATAATNASSAAAAASSAATSASSAATALGTAGSGLTNIGDSRVQQIHDGIFADRHIDTTTNPYNHVLIKSGTGAIGTGTELLRQGLYNASDTAITDLTTTVVHAVVT